MSGVRWTVTCEYALCHARRTGCIDLRIRQLVESNRSRGCPARFFGPRVSNQLPLGPLAPFRRVLVRSKRRRAICDRR